MRILLISVFYALTAACVYKNYKYKDGDTWVVRSTFVMKCTILKSGSWSAKVIGCRTSGGVFVEPGHSIIEGDTKYDCLDMGHDHVEIRRTYYNGGKQESCEGHVIGESWVSQYNFRKTCTENGARITECLTDAGFAVPLNRHLVFSGIIYKCTLYRNGTVSIDRESIPLAANSSSRLKPVDVLGPMWKSFGHLGRLVQSQETFDNEPMLDADTSLRSQHTAHNEKAVICVSNGIVHHPAETWISDNHFIKKCTSDGSTTTVSCLIDANNILDVGKELKLDGNTYKCYRSPTDRSVHFEVSPN